MFKFHLLALLCVIELSVFSQRNTVLVIADDVGTDYFGFYADHQDTVAVRNIRYLMNRGILFTEAMSNPVCSATRASILTGRYSFRTGVGGIVGGTGGSNSIDTGELTIPRQLKIFNSNIGTADIGKWHLCTGTPQNLLNPNIMGYDYFAGPFIGQLPSFTNWTQTINGVSATCTTYATTENVNNAVNWVRTQGSNPFFLWLAFNAPHEPLHLPPAGLHSYTGLSGTTMDINQHPISYFKADLQALDTELGRLMDSLRAMNKLDSTDFIFIGDNGNTLRTSQIADSNKAKGTIYQYGVHVPFIVSGPSVVNPGRVSNALVNLADIYATVLDLFGASNWPTHVLASKPVDSKSIYPIIKNTATSVRPWTFAENFKLTPDANDGKAMRNTDYKLLKFDSGIEEFYHLAVDYGEANNLLATGTMTATDINNYNYLCNEMSLLLSRTPLCTTNVAVPDLLDTSGAPVVVFPNPFNSIIHLSDVTPNAIYCLSDQFGKIFYFGSDIEKQRFSALNPGIYYLQVVTSSSTQTLKLVKE